MTYAFFKRLMGAEAVDRIINAMEYTPHLDNHWDPFSLVHNVSLTVDDKPGLENFFLV